MRNKLFIFLLYQLAFLLWCFKLHGHFFEFTLADQAGLTIAAVMPLVILRFNFHKELKHLWAVNLILPLGLYPLISFNLPFFSDVWVLLYIVLFASGCVILLSGSSTRIWLGLFATTTVWLLPFPFQENQLKYYDFLDETISTRFGETDIVGWKKDRWIYYNSSLVSSTADGHMYSETLVHTSIPHFKSPKVLLIGDDFGITRKEINKYNCDLTHIPYDKEILRKMNPTDEPIIATDIMTYLSAGAALYDVIIIDLPDPEHLPFRHFYQEDFYRKCMDNLTSEGILMTNAGGYYTKEKYYQKIDAALNGLHMNTQVLQTLIPTLGHRVWVMARSEELNLNELSIEVPTIWLDKNAMQLLMSKGKESYPF